MKEDGRRLTRWLLLPVAVSLAIIGLRTATYRAYFRQPGSWTYFAEAVGLLLLYAGIILWLTRRPRGGGWWSLQPGTAFGLVGGAVQCVHLCVERFATLRGAWNGGVTLTFMLGTFVLWGVVGFVSKRRGMTLPMSIGRAAWSAMVTMTIAVCFGTALELYLAPIPESSMLAWPEFRRSGWTDLHAFAIANTLDSIVSHLMVAPLVGLVVGAIGGLLGMLRGRS